MPLAAVSFRPAWPRSSNLLRVGRGGRAAVADCNADGLTCLMDAEMLAQGQAALDGMVTVEGPGAVGSPRSDRGG